MSRFEFFRFRSIGGALAYADRFTIPLCVFFTKLSASCWVFGLPLCVLNLCLFALLLLSHPLPRWMTTFRRIPGRIISFMPVFISDVICP
jgi:hypothetical protein